MTPVCTHNVWGGVRLREEFGYSVNGNDLGECWGISAHEKGMSLIASGEYMGKTLAEMWDQYPELFGRCDRKDFPLLIKVIDANDSLSVQVHPDDQYAAIHEQGASGKTECWYILDCPEDAELTIGHNAQTREELVNWIERGAFHKLVRSVPVKKGDFIQIDPGTIHAITKGMLILETQQSSDITYRVYDYGRMWNGTQRTLHLSQCMDVISVPSYFTADNVISTQGFPLNELCLLHECSYYQVMMAHVSGQMVFDQRWMFLNMSVVEGAGQINGISIERGSHFILPYQYGNVELRGEMKLIMSTVGRSDNGR